MNDCTPAPGRAAQIQPRQWLVGALLSLTASVLAAAEPAVVDTARVDERRWQQTVPLYGTLTSPRDADVTPRIAGLVPPSSRTSPTSS